MIPLLMGALLQIPPAAPSPAATDVARMATLYDEICLHTFPDDAALDRLMSAKKATPLSASDVRIILRDDPGRGWLLRDGGERFTVTLELPPFHACSLRAAHPSAGPTDLTAYQRVAASYVARTGGFSAQPPIELDQGGIHIHGEIQTRALPNGDSDNLIVVDQRIADPSQLAAGTTATPLRFVHQIAPRR
ncbi:hypothetical protein D9601_03995 [Sphingomonas sp. MA1305]|uniref:NMCC_0638 family (lipo)protein n=1 Tax=Sphingomonas sp. MA1305 TaxID=2479204 RepID=UPI0018E05BE9|nr:hypothetical protein [Sphingomonas sp. MA1305]MBI0474524.1 hypothetical protein [Sphingomonas sp. MA1305]